jgi:hypothetical protein
MKRRIAILFAPFWSRRSALQRAEGRCKRGYRSERKRR